MRHSCWGFIESACMKILTGRSVRLSTSEDCARLTAPRLRPARFPAPPLVHLRAETCNWASDAAIATDWRLRPRLEFAVRVGVCCVRLRVCVRIKTGHTVSSMCRRYGGRAPSRVGLAALSFLGSPPHCSAYMSFLGSPPTFVSYSRSFLLRVV